MRCVQCDRRVGGLFGALHARGITCPAEDCDAVVCVDCLPELVVSREVGIGPLRRGSLEIPCPECDTIMFHSEFSSELLQSAKNVVGKGKKLVRETLLESGLKSLKRRGRKKE